MTKLKLSGIEKIFEKIRLIAGKNIAKNNFEKSLSQIGLAAKIAYHFNWKYFDKELELMLKEISSKLNINNDFKPRKNRVVFYDSFSIDNRGLTQQYIRAIIKMGYELLYISENNYLTNSSNIIQELQSSKLATIITLDNSVSIIENINKFQTAINDFQPEKAFLHMSPWSSMGVVLWNEISNVERYMINLTDHAFWLGSTCFDYCLEFRNYGYTVSIEKRNIDPNKLIYQPYYPILEDKPFQGIPNVFTENKIIIFTGGSLYKMYGENNLFFCILEALIKIDPKVVIHIAGGGDSTPLKKFLTKRKLESKILLLGERPDIVQIMSKSDIYLSTYPLTGGLMGQLAAVNSKPILSYTSDDISFNSLEDILFGSNKTGQSITLNNLEDFMTEARKLIKNKNYREQRGREILNDVFTKKQFDDSFKDIMSRKKSYQLNNRVKINYNKFTELYLDAENNYLQNLYPLIIKELGKSVLLYFPQVVLKSIFSSKTKIRAINYLIRKFRAFSFSQKY